MASRKYIKRPFNCDHIAELITGISRAEYKEIHKKNPDDPRIRLGEHIRDFIRLDRWEKFTHKDGTPSADREAAEAIGKFICSLEPMIKAFKEMKAEI